MFRQTYFQQRNALKKVVQSNLLLLLNTHIEQLKLIHPHKRGIPDFELRTPSNPLTQIEMIQFIDDGTTGPHDTPWDKELRRLEREEKLWLKQVREHTIKNRPSFTKKLDESEYTEEHAVASFHRNESLRRKHGRYGKKPYGYGGNEEVPPGTPFYPEICTLPRPEHGNHTRWWSVDDVVAMGGNEVIEHEILTGQWDL
ncbi:MAG TPA: hypothetical protein VL335_00050 [Candidatus Paceibacterota bacterium]|jgi:hypothetical protein|nr:hypothetical protein [Candidatus Paceibacterota bacterium]